MKAVRFYGARDVRYEECPEPPPPGEGQVLVRPVLCGVCGTDLHEYIDGPHWTPKQRHAYGGAELPQILGHEFCGEVVSTGPNVRNLSMGDRVSVQPILGDTGSYYGQRAMFLFDPRSAIVGLTWPWGGMADLVLVNDYNAVPLPDDLSDEQGALIEPAAVAVQAVDRSGMKSGDTMLVTGGGPIGALVAMAARAAGAAHVAVSQTSPGRRRRLAEIGAGDTLIDARSEDVAEKARATSADRLGVDVAVECSGNPAALQQCIDAVRPMGTVVVAGVIHKAMPLQPMQWFTKGIDIHATNGYPAHCWPRVIQLIRSGRLPVERLVDRTIAAEDIVADAFVPLMEARQPFMKILVRP